MAMKLRNSIALTTWSESGNWGRGGAGIIAMVNILANFSYLCPNPQNFRSLFLPCFSRHFLSRRDVDRKNFVKQSSENVNMARSAEILGKFRLK